MLGREVAQVVAGPMDAGAHTVTFDAAALPVGNRRARGPLAASPPPCPPMPLALLPVAADLLRVVSVALPAVGGLVLLAGVVILVRFRRGPSRSLFATMGGATLVLAGALLLALAIVVLGG